MGCFVVAGFVLTSASRSPSAIAKLLVVHNCRKSKWTDLPSVKIRRLSAVRSIQRMCVTIKLSKRNDLVVFAVTLERITFNIKVQQRSVCASMSQAKITNRSCTENKQSISLIYKVFYYLQD